MKIQVSWDVTDILEKCSATSLGVKQSKKIRNVKALHPTNTPMSTYHSIQQNVRDDLNP
jgi:hypothetical protein